MTVRRLFGTDGVRGHANLFPMTVEVALALGRAAALVLRKSGGKKRVVIGKDTRLSCYMFENALIAGFCSMGVDTLMVGPLPTPGVAFITRACRADAGVVISASHNAYYDNGIKFFSSEGYKLPDRLEAEMEALIESKEFSNLPADADVGKNTKIADADGRYIESVKATFPKKMTLKDMRIVLDCAHGAAFRVAPLVFRELDAEVFLYGAAPNGVNINEGCGALHPGVVQRGVIDHGAHVGIAVDGDGDRVIMVDEKANVVDGDTLLAICAHDMQQRGTLRNSRVVGTVMSNWGFLKSMEALGIEVIQAPVGDRYVIQEMLLHEANLGGEQSGHLMFLEHNTTADGLVSALQVLRIMRETQSTLFELASVVKHYPQVLVNVRVDKKPPLEELEGVQKTIRKVEESLGKTGRVLVRYSGTESICRVMVEGPKQQLAEHYAEQIAASVREALSCAGSLVT